MNTKTHLSTRQHQFLQRAGMLSFAALLLGVGTASAQQNHFLPPVKNPFGWNATYKGVKYPQIVDLENDGLLDFCFLDSTGYAYVKNTGTATNPDFSTAATRSPFNMPSPERMRALIDVDGDGLLDLMHIDSVDSAPYTRYLTYIPNTGNSTIPVWSTPSVRKYKAGYSVHACVVGFDGDGDGRDNVLATSYYGNDYYYFRNDSLPVTIPTGIRGISGNFSEFLSFADMDNDGDLDVWRITGRYYVQNDWKIQYAENISTNDTASFGAYTNFPMGVDSIFSNGAIVLPGGQKWLYPSILTADMNDDGDVDLFIPMALDTNLVMYENTKCDTNNTAPAITQTAGTISTGAGLSSYQWYSVDAQGVRTPVQGATSATFAPTTDGSYTVRAKKTNGCVAYAADFAYVYIGVNSVADANLWNISPNPVTSELFVQSDLTWLRWEIIDAQGRVIRTIAKPTTNNINVSELPQGIYTLRGQAADGKSAISRFVKK